jgi:AraC-like DNA-binding protein
VRAVASATDLLADPVGSYVVGRTFVVWVQTRRRFGFYRFGTLDITDEPMMSALFALPSSPKLGAQYDCVFDFYAVDAIYRRSYDIWVGDNAVRARSEISKRGRRFAMVRPQGIVGATFTGLFHDPVPLSNAELFADRDAALAWIGVVPGSAERLEIDQVLAPFEQPPMLRRVRELITADVRGASLERAAAALGHSPRSLQRHLAALKTSFRREVTYCRLQAAQRLLLGSDDKVDAIAAELGFQSAAAFITMFGRVVGESPSAFRDRRNK